MGSCTGLINRCTFGSTNQQAGSYTPATELELIRFRNFPFGDLVWNPSTQVNGDILAAYITVFDPIRGKHRLFIPFLVFVLVYTSIASNLATLDTLSLCSDSVRTHTCSAFLRKPLLR